MRRPHAGEYDGLVHMVRGFLGYLSLIVLFGGVIFIVQASMEVKRIRYKLTEANVEKERLLDDLMKVNNKISELERFTYIAERLETALPHLGPPRHPAIELETPGLQTRTGPPEAPVELLVDHSPLARLRNSWNALRQTVRGWLSSVIK